MSPTAMNTYGYNYTENCITQLQRVLNLEDRPSEFKDAKENIKTLVKRYLDIHQTGFIQTREMSKIQQKLKKRYPEHYGGEPEDSNKKLFFVGKFILYIHNQRRKEARRLASGAPLADSPSQNSANPKALATLNNTGEPSNQSHATKPFTRTPYLPSSSEQTSVSTASTNDSKSMDEGRGSFPIFPPTPLSAVRPHPRKSRFIPVVMISSIKLDSALKPNGPSKATISSSQSSTQDIDPILNDNTDRHVQYPPTPSPPTPSGSRAAPEPSSSVSSGPTNASGSTDHARTDTESGIAFVHEFLLACKPSMGHFLSRFVDFGWKNKDFLFAMSTWSDAYRYQMLSRVVGTTTRDGEGQGSIGATEAEIAVLDYHLMRYGFQVEKENAEV